MAWICGPSSAREAQCLNPVVVLPKQRPNLLLLFCRQFQIFRKVRELLVDRSGCMDFLKLLASRGLLRRIFLGHGRTNHTQHQHNSTGKRKGRLRMDGNLLEEMRRHPG